jgi:hypothetical protein
VPVLTVWAVITGGDEGSALNGMIVNMMVPGLFGIIHSRKLQEISPHGWGNKGMH